METPPVSRFDSPYTDRAILLGIVLVGAALRFTALDTGIPFSPAVDEQEIVDRALNMMKTGTYNPTPFFDYPTLYMYVQFFTAVVRYIVGAMNGMWSSLDQAMSPDFYWNFFPWGRAVTAAFGTATILVTYGVARRIGRVAALAAAVLVATQPMLVSSSHFILTDTPMAFFVALTMFLSVRACERGTTTSYLAAGVAAGLAAATKYNGGVAVLMPLLALVVGGSQPAPLMSVVAVAGGAAGAFLLAAPYTVIELPAFLNAFGRLTNMYAQAGRDADPAWLTYWKHLRLNMFTEGLMVAVASLLVAAVRIFRGPRAERVAWGSAALFVTVWFLMLLSQGGIRYGRYLIPLLPPLFVLVGGAIGNVPRFIVALRSRHLPRVAILVGLIALVVARPTIASVSWVNDKMKVTTTIQAYQWMLQNIPTGSHVAVETRMLLLPPERYTSTNEPRLINRSFDDYVEKKVQYLIASSQSFAPFEAPDRRGSPEGMAYRELFRRLELLHTELPSKDHPGPEIRIYRLIP